MYIFGSPREKRSTSYALAGYGLPTPLAEKRCLFRGDGIWRPEDRVLLAEHQVWLVAFPLYVDGIPGPFAAWLEAAEKSGAMADRLIYILLQNGYYEGEQCQVALEMAKNWIASGKASFGGSLVVAAAPFYLGLSRRDDVSYGDEDLLQGLRELRRAMAHEKQMKPRMVSIPLSRQAFIAENDRLWERLAKRNGLTSEDLDRRWV